MIATPDDTLGLALNGIRGGHMQVKPDGPHWFKITGKCPISRDIHSIKVRVADFYAFKVLDDINVAFRNYTPDEREFLISGTSPKGWDKAFPKEDDE